MRVLFLDIDGVLNGYNKWTYLLIDISKFLHIPTNFMRKRLNIFGIRETYVRRLAKIVKSTDAKVVMSSSWRNGYWYTPYEEKTGDRKKLHDLLVKYGIEVIDITPTLCGKREDEINQWLNNTNLNVKSFVILDDESFDIQSFVGKQLVKTSSVKEGQMIQGLARENTGLKRKHVKKAIKILKGEK